MRHNCTMDSAQDVLDRISILVSVDVQIVEEIRKEGKTLEQTAAGSVRREELDALIAQHKEEIAGFQAEMEALKGSNSELRQELAADKAEMEQKLRKWEEDKAILMSDLETERTARQILEVTVKEGQQWRIEQDEAKGILERGLEAEKKAREALEREIKEQHSRVEHEIFGCVHSLIYSIFQPSDRIHQHLSSAFVLHIFSKPSLYTRDDLLMTC